MESFLLVYRLVAVAIVVFWIWQLMTTRGKPADWMPPRADRSSLRIARDRYRVAGVIGIVAGVAVLAVSFVVPFNL